MKRKIKNSILLMACLMIAFVCIKYDNNKHVTTKQENKVTNYQTVVFKDKQDTMIPIEIDFNQKLEDDAKYRNMLEVMKSVDYEYLGLYPILDADLEVNAISLNNKALTFDFSDNLKVNSNQEALDLYEMFSYVFCNDDIERINLKIDGNDVDTLANSTISASCITNQLGINNFEATTNYIYKTTPVVVYNTKMINNQEYYVPVTRRIETNENDLDTKVSIMLKELNYDKPLSISDQCTLEDGLLTIHLNSNVLNDNETIDNILYNRIIKSASHISNVTKVSIFIDNQEITPMEDVNGEVDNRIKI